MSYRIPRRRRGPRVARNPGSFAGPWPASGGPIPPTPEYEKIQEDEQCEPNMRMPDFFIVGAPKCGTSAMSFYLRNHPHVFLCEPKEPHYFCTDFPGLRQVSSKRAYLELFRSAPSSSVWGEASVWYLFSEAAVANIVRENPEAQVIVMLRNPVEMTESLHAQLVFAMEEDVTDFETAWNLQSKRASGEHIPRFCREPKFLQYRAVASYSTQLERLFRLVSRHRVLLLIYEEFAADPSAAYRRALDFLGLPDDGRTSFPRINESRMWRSVRLARWARGLPLALGRLYHPAKSMLNLVGLRPGTAIDAWNRRIQPRPPLSSQVKAQLSIEFGDEMERLERLLARPLDAWQRSACWTSCDAEAKPGS